MHVGLAGDVDFLVGVLQTPEEDEVLEVYGDLVQFKVLVRYEPHVHVAVRQLLAVEGLDEHVVLLLLFCLVGGGARARVGGQGALHALQHGDEELVDSGALPHARPADDSVTTS